MVSERRCAQLGLLSACLLMAATLMVIYRGSHETPSSAAGGAANGVRLASAADQ